jgi:hypothetical protein
VCAIFTEWKCWNIDRIGGRNKRRGSSHGHRADSKERLYNYQHLAAALARRGVDHER